MSSPSSDQPRKPDLPVAKPKPLPLPADAPPTARRAGSGDRERERTRDRVADRDRNRDDQPRSRRRQDEDDDAPKKGSALPVILIVGGALFVLVILGGAGVLIAVLANKSQQAKAQRMADEEARYRAEVEADRRWRDNDPWVKEPEPWPPGGPGGPGMPAGPEPWDKPKPPRPGPVFADITPHDLKPAPLADDTVEVKLPGTVADTCSGGGGRFLIAHISGKKQLAVFDVNEAKVVKYLALASDSVQIAAGMNKLIVAYPAENTLVRYDLTTFDKEATEKLPGEGALKKIALGSASAGPLLVARGSEFPGGQSKLAFYDPNTLAAVDIQLENGQFWREWGDGDHLRASPDGRVFTAHGTGGLTSIVVRGGSAKWYNAVDAFGHATPGPDGNVYTGYGQYTGEFKRVGRTPANGAAQQLLPAAEGILHLQLTTEGNNGGIGGPPGGGAGDGPKVRAEVRMPGDDRPLHTFKDIGPFAADQWATVSSPPLDRRVHFVPAAKLLLSVPSGNTKLVLRKFDLDAALDASGVDYLVVTSRPPTAVAGKGYDYQIDAKSKRGGLKYTLDAGPEGLTVSATGRVSWTAPDEFTVAEPVIITVSDSSGQEVYHTFELTAGDGKRLAGPISGTARPRGGADDGKKGLVPLPDRVFELKPPNLQQKAEVKLPGAVDAACAAGGGRFIVYRIPSAKRLAVLDVVAGRVVKQVPLAEADALFAAGMTRLFVFNKAAGVLLRYDLETFDKELTAASPLGGTPTVLLMGHASDGPLFVGGPGVGGDARGYGFVNARTLKELTVSIDGGASGPAVSNPQVGGGGATGLAVSPDGRTYCWADNWNGGVRVMTLNERTAKVKSDNGGSGMGAVVPGPDGTLFGSTGLWTADLKKVGDVKKTVYGTFAPATSGPWYVSVIEGDRFAPGGATPRKVSVGLTSDEGVKFPLDAVSGLPVGDPWGGVPPGGAALAKVPLAGRLHLVPEAEVMAVLDDSMEKVFLHRLPLKPLLDKADKDYLMVVSKPPPAVRGGRWTYTPEVWSKKGGVKVKLESGPDGLTESGGTLTWDVPGKGEDEAAVLLTVSDASGQETFHSFTVAVRPDADPAAAVIRPKVSAVTPPKPGPGVKPADPPAFALKPTAAKDGSDIDLPAAADAACLAGGGRFILFRIPSKKVVAVFDVVDGTLAKQLPLAEEGALVAGGRSFAVVVNPKAGVVVRWNLNTFEKAATTKLPDGFAPTAAVMGHASDGPLLLGANGQVYKAVNANGLYDPLTLKKVELKSADPNVGHYLPSDYSADALHASPDGRVFAWRNPVAYPTGAYALILDGPLARTHGSSIAAGPVFAGADGHLYTGAGVISADQKKLIDTVTGLKAETWGLTFNGTPGRGAIPGSDGPWYLWLPPTKFDAKTEPPPVLKMTGVKESLATLKDLRGMAAVKDDNPFERPGPGVKKVAEVLPFHRRAFLIPAAELLAVLSPDGTKVHVHAFKARDLLDKSGQDYLLVMNRPPQYAPRGAKWGYIPDVWSKAGGVKVELVSGPPAMKADGAGVTWEVPDDLLDTLVTVELKVSDASGKSLAVRFAVSLDESTPPPPAPPIGSTAPGGPGKGDAKGKGKEDGIVGVWAVDKVDFGGLGAAPLQAELEKMRFTFGKDGTARVTGAPGGDEGPGTYKLDPTATPRAIDITTTNSGREETMLGLYELTGDTLKICFGITPGSARPTELKVSGTETGVITLKRVKE